MEHGNFHGAIKLLERRFYVGEREREIEERCWG
jgi:hypothetical protein